MKKAKWMITAIALIGIVGGALAFKAQKFTAVDIYGCTGSHGTCTRLKLSATYTSTSGTQVDGFVSDGTSTVSCNQDSDCPTANHHVFTIAKNE